VVSAAYAKFTRAAAHHLCSVAAAVDAAADGNDDDDADVIWCWLSRRIIVI